MSHSIIPQEVAASYNRLTRNAQFLLTAADFHQMFAPETGVDSIFASLSTLQDQQVKDELVNAIINLVKEPDVLNMIGNQFFSKGQARIAVDFYEASFQGKPENPHPLKRKGNALRVIGEVEQAIQAYRQALAIRYDSGLHSRMLLAMHYDVQWTAEEIAAEHFTWHHDRANPAHQLPAIQSDQPDKAILKIAYLSPDFKSHPVSYFFQPIVLHHDKSRFHVTCYSTQSGNDGITRRIKGACDAWCDAERMSTLDLAQKIRTDQIDILIDLAGHTSGNRLDVFQLHPAPIQITYLGYPNGVGMAQMDYRITDEVADPSACSGHLYREKLVRVEPCFLTFEPPAGRLEVAPAPCSTNGFITFGSFNKFSKLSGECIATWVKILNQVTSSRLFLKTGGLENADEKRRALDRFHQAGLQDVSRVEIHDLVPSRTDHLLLYDRIDIALDPFPYNGTTTTCQALWMGVPVISLRGDRHVARVGASILAQMGLEALVADSMAGYVEIACKLAQQPAQVMSLRQKIRLMMEASPLLDHRGFTQKLESLFRSLWIKKCGDAF
jgi:predicted O-linked N-acetylglucosamine transferase (SPINDLY family)